MGALMSKTVPARPAGPAPRAGGATTIAHCRSCDAPILWLRHARTGKRAPIDAEPVPEGNIVVGDDGTYVTLNAAQAAEVASRGGPLHFNHFMTCPDAADWR
jgi:hypothetical protein